MGEGLDREIEHERMKNLLFEIADGPEMISVRIRQNVKDFLEKYFPFECSWLRFKYVVCRINESGEMRQESPVMSLKAGDTFTVTFQVDSTGKLRSDWNGTRQDRT